MSTAELARVLARSHGTVDPHLAFLRYLVETGKINDFELTDEAGERVPDPGVRHGPIEEDHSPRAMRRGWMSR